jgi:hypothetical protein
MTKQQAALELTVLWQEANNIFGQMQEVASGNGYNGFIQIVETIRENLDDAVSQATGDESWPLLVDENPNWRGIIPFDGEVSPDEVIAKESGIPLTDERFNQRQLDLAQETNTSPMGWK